MASSFSPGMWHDNICNLGHTPEYDQSAYDGYITMVHDVRLAMAIIVALIDLVVVVFAFLCRSRRESYYLRDRLDRDSTRSHTWSVGGFLLLGLAGALTLLIIVPVYVAL